jgi:signal transduction histidine kinase/ligand-binding sensor domain-containing protein
LKNNILFIFFLLLFIPIDSQKSSIQFYNTDNGLPQNSVKDITKDKYGFIWLSTENGIARYDGNSFLVYKNFPLNTQRFLYFYGNVEKDSIFVKTEFKQNLLIHGKNPKVSNVLRNYPIFILKNNTNYLLYCSNFTYAATGTSFYMNFKEGRYYIHKNSLTYKDFTSKVEQNLDVKTIYENVPRVFAIDEMLFYTDYQSKTVLGIKKGKIVNSHHNPLLTDPKSRILWSQINNQVFIVNNSTIYTCNYENGQLKTTKLIRLNNVKDENFVSIYYDKKYNKIYLGSSINGLQVISFPDFTCIKRPPSKPESVFYSTIPYGNSSVITTFGEIYNRNGLVEDKKFKDASSYFLDYDADGNIITLSGNNLKVYQKSTFYKDIITKKNLIIKDLFSDGQKYYALLKDIRNEKAMVVNGILAVYKDKSLQSLEKKIFFQNEPTKFIKFDKYHLLVGTVKNLYKISLTTNKIYNLIGKQQLFIRNIIRSKDGNFWVLTLGKGLYLLKNNRLIKMPYDPDNNISSPHTILEDKNGFFWISTNNGLYKILESQLLEYAENKRSKVYYYKYSKDAGFNINEFNGGSNICGNILENGDFVLPSLNGLVFFNPLKVKSYYPENLYIERAVVNNKEQYFKNNLSLDQDVNRIDIFIDVPYYSNLDNVVIEAKLGNSPNAKWEPIGKDRKFSISSLGYGNHSLMVKMLVSDEGKFIYKKINIIVPPYFYQTLWFKIVTSSLLLLLLYFLVKWRINFLKKKNQELEKTIASRTKSLSDTVEKLEITKAKLHKEVEQQKKLIGTITHDITTPIKFIALTAKEVLDAENFNEQLTGKILNSIYKSSDQLYNFTMTLKEYADIYTHHRLDDSELYSLHQLIEDKKILFDEIAKNNGTVIINNVDKALSIWISKNILSAIVHNLIDNSVKYTKNGTITIESTNEDEHISLLITDTGIGMEQKKIEYYTRLQDNIENEKLLLQKYGMGLHLVLQLLQMIDGKIIFEKNKLQGTSFKLILINKKNA